MLNAAQCTSDCQLPALQTPRLLILKWSSVGRKRQGWAIDRASGHERSIPREQPSSSKEMGIIVTASPFPLFFSRSPVRNPNPNPNPILISSARRLKCRLDAKPKAARSLCQTGRWTARALTVKRIVRLDGSLVDGSAPAHRSHVRRNCSRRLYRGTCGQRQLSG